MCGIGLVLSLLRAAKDAHLSLVEALAKLLERRGPDVSGAVDIGDIPQLHVSLLAGVLHMRGESCIPQPMQDETGDVFCWNGEVFGGVTVPASHSDTDIIFEAVKSCGGDVRLLAEQMGHVLGPWSFIYYSAKHKAIFFARDPVGRRSLVMMKPTEDNGGSIVISSVAARLPNTDEYDVSRMYPYEEVQPTGIYKLCLASLAHGVSWESALIHEPWPVNIPAFFGLPKAGFTRPPAPIERDAAPLVPQDTLAVCAIELLHRLSESVRLRVQNMPTKPCMQTDLMDRTALFECSRRGSPITQAVEGLAIHSIPSNASQFLEASGEAIVGAQVAVLFSGGLDSMVLAALAHTHADPAHPIDLINVCFSLKRDSPDRLAAIVGVQELRSLFPSRQWQLICVDEVYDNPLKNQHHMANLLAPNLSHMDFNIGSALWYASRGIGYVDVGDTATDAAQVKAALRYGSCSDVATAASKVHNLSDYDNGQAGDAKDAHAITVGTMAPEGLVSALKPHGNVTFSAEKSHCEFVSSLHTEVQAVIDSYVAMIDKSKCDDSLVIRDTSKIAHSSADLATPAPSIDEDASVAAVSEPVRTRRCAGVAQSGSECAAVPHRKCAKRMCRSCCINKVTEKACAVHGTPTHISASGEVSVAASSHGALTTIDGKAVDTTPATTTTFPTTATSTAAAVTTTSTSVAVTTTSTSAAPTDSTPSRLLCRSSARVLLLGIGADEQMCGYARHRSVFLHGAWHRLREEADLDCARIWRRNFGRDDRVCSDHGREIRLPYMDEAVSGYLRRLPMPVVADLRLPYGVGDKRILRVVARALGIVSAASLVKRAIHFGSRIAKQSNVTSFGSNRAGKGDVPFLFKQSAEEDG